MSLHHVISVCVCVSDVFPKFLWPLQVAMVFQHHVQDVAMFGITDPRL